MGVCGEFIQGFPDYLVDPNIQCRGNPKDCVKSWGALAALEKRNESASQVGLKTEEFLRPLFFFSELREGYAKCLVVIFCFHAPVFETHAGSSNNSCQQTIVINNNPSECVLVGAEPHHFGHIMGKDNGQQLRALIERVSLTQSAALKLFNGNQMRPLSLSQWKSYLAQESSSRRFPCPNAVLERAQRLFKVAKK